MTFCTFADVDTWQGNKPITVSAVRVFLRSPYAWHSNRCFSMAVGNTGVTTYVTVGSALNTTEPLLMLLLKLVFSYCFMSKWLPRVTSAVVYNSICCVFVFHRITLSCLPASWYCSVSLLSLGCAPRQRLLLLLLLLITSVFFLLETYQRQLWGTQRRSGTQINK